MGNGTKRKLELVLLLTKERRCVACVCVCVCVYVIIRGLENDRTTLYCKMGNGAGGFVVKRP